MANEVDTREKAAAGERQRAEAVRIGRRLRWAREAQEMTRQELADYAGIHQTMVRHMEDGSRVPSLFLAQTLIHILGISPQYLLWGVLEGVDAALVPSLRRQHPELRLPAEVRRKELPAPGKTRTTRRNSRPTDCETADQTL